MSEAKRTERLYLYFHGRIIDSLGIQMYQSPVAAIAELIANAWDADAQNVVVTLPQERRQDAIISISDDGTGMTFQQCQNYYLKVGRNRRSEDGLQKSLSGRPVLGRKGIGKFAGFGIADVVRVETISAETGERTAFELDLSQLKGQEFVDTSAFELPIVEISGPDVARKSKHGTTITLKGLKVQQVRGADAFARSMARRFLINQQSDNFAVRINGVALPTEEFAQFEFDFPNDYRAAEKPAGLTLDEGWGKETLSGGREIRWRIRFTKTPIEINEFRGISVYCGVKVAQTPFFFELSGGMSGQHGQQYVTGIVKADYLDQLDADVITTERQRINWENDEAAHLLEWGQERIKSLLAIWKERRAEEKLKLLNERLVPFAKRLEKLPPSERKIVSSAIRKIASIDSLDEPQFISLSESILTAWEGGRLRVFIQDVAQVGEMTEAVLLAVLAEAQVLNALQVAEAIKAKERIVRGLAERIKNRELENAVRDYIAENPWLLSPRWETFKKETSVKNLVEAAAKEAKLDESPDWDKRVDLVLSAGVELLVIEFMRPGLAVDRDHLERFQRYVDILREKIGANTALPFNHVTGLLVADKLERLAGVMELLKRMSAHGMNCLEWHGLLEQAGTQWKEFFDVVVERAPEDDRIAALKTEGSSAEN